MHEEWDSLELDFARVLAASASTSTRCVTVQVSASGDEGDNNTDTERGDGVEVLQPLGLMAVPAITATTQAPFQRVGDQMVALGIVDKGAPAQAVEEGEARLYGVGSGNSTANVRVRNSGAVEVNAKSNANVALNVDGTGGVVRDGGSLKVARVTDSVRVGTLAGTAPSGGGPVVFTFVPLDASGAPGTPVVNATVTIAAVIASAGGAAHVKA